MNGKGDLSAMVGMTSRVRGAAVGMGGVVVGVGDSSAGSGGRRKCVGVAGMVM